MIRREGYGVTLGDFFLFEFTTGDLYPQAHKKGLLSDKEVKRGKVCELTKKLEFGKNFEGEFGLHLLKSLSQLFLTIVDRR